MHQSGRMLDALSFIHFPLSWSISLPFHPSSLSPCSFSTAQLRGGEAGGLHPGDHIPTHTLTLLPSVTQSTLCLPLHCARSSEEDRLEGYIKAIADAGARVVVSGGAIGEMAMHFLEKYRLMAIRIPSKFDLRRFCRATGAVALVKLAAPQPDELGFAKQVRARARVVACACMHLRGTCSAVQVRLRADSCARASLLCLHLCLHASGAWPELLPCQLPAACALFRVRAAAGLHCCKCAVR